MMREGRAALSSAHENKISRPVQMKNLDREYLPVKRALRIVVTTARHQQSGRRIRFTCELSVLPKSSRDTNHHYSSTVASERKSKGSTPESRTLPVIDGGVKNIGIRNFTGPLVAERGLHFLEAL